MATPLGALALYKLVSLNLGDSSVDALQLLAGTLVLLLGIFVAWYCACGRGPSRARVETEDNRSAPHVNPDSILEPGHANSSHEGTSRGSLLRPNRGRKNLPRPNRGRKNLQRPSAVESEQSLWYCSGAGSSCLAVGDPAWVSDRCAPKTEPPDHDGDVKKGRLVLARLSTLDGRTWH